MSLYQTLIAGEIDMTKDPPLQQLIKKIATLTRQQTEEVLVLIAEHARLEEKHDFFSENAMLPYGGKFADNEVTFNVDLLPRKLKWVIWKFLIKIQNIV